MLGGVRSFPFGAYQPKRSLLNYGSFGAWRLNEYVEVKKLQAKYNADRRISQTEHSSDSSAPVIRTGAITEDGKWGPNTMTAVKAWVDYKVRKGDCTTTSGTEAERNGPNAFSACLVNAGFTSAEIANLQVAWSEYKSEAARQSGLERAEEDSCRSRGGTWDSTAGRCIEPEGGSVSDDGGVSGGEPREPTGMSTGTKLLLVVLGAAALIGIYYVATD